MKIASKTHPGLFYDVKMTTAGWACTCPHHRYRGAKCKHIQEALRNTVAKDTSFDRAVAVLFATPVLEITGGILCGSYRRGKDRVGDLDVLVSCTDRSFRCIRRMVQARFHPIYWGEQKCSFIIPLSTRELQVDINRTEQRCLGNALQHFTGSKEENIRIRKIALRKGWSMSQHGFVNLTTNKLVCHEHETEVYDFLGEAFKQPSER